jgi:monothiol glutaredoxin
VNSDFKQRIDKLVEENKVVLFMKGNRQNPKCGFSAKVVGMLEELERDYETVDVLSDPEVRSGMKNYSSWPTFPQLYVEKEFVGGCDIITGMFQSGELHKMIGVEMVEVTPPNVTLSEGAVNAFKSALQRYDGSVHIEITSNFQYDIGIGPKSPGSIEVMVEGVSLLFSRSAAKRADGMSIDYQAGGGLVINNPNEPPSVKGLEPRELKQWMDTGKELHLFDVRGADERAIASIAGAKALEDFTEMASELPKDTLLVFQCHHGMRSHVAAQDFVSKGFSNVYNLDGGIHGWSLNVDTEVPTY